MTRETVEMESTANSKKTEQPEGLVGIVAAMWNGMEFADKTAGKTEKASPPLSYFSLFICLLIIIITLPERKTRLPGLNGSVVRVFFCGVRWPLTVSREQLASRVSLTVACLSS